MRNINRETNLLSVFKKGFSLKDKLRPIAVNENRSAVLNFIVELLGSKLSNISILSNQPVITAKLMSNVSDATKNTNCDFLFDTRLIMKKWVDSK